MLLIVDYHKATGGGQVPVPRPCVRPCGEEKYGPGPPNCKFGSGFTVYAPPSAVCAGVTRGKKRRWTEFVRMLHRLRRRSANR